MTTRQALVEEFMKLAVEDVREAGFKPTLHRRHQVLTDWCAVYEDVPPRNRAETAVFDALLMARDQIGQRIHSHLATAN